MLMRHLGPGCPLTSSQENKMDVWLSGQAVARLTELLAVVAAAPGTSDQHRCQLYSCSSQVEELMPASELLALAGVLREATDRPGLSAAVRTDCWSWSSYLASLLVVGPTATATTNPPAATLRRRHVVTAAALDQQGSAVSEEAVLRLVGGWHADAFTNCTGSVEAGALGSRSRVIGFSCHGGCVLELCRRAW